LLLFLLFFSKLSGWQGSKKKPSCNVGIGGRVGRWGWGISGTKTDTEQSHEGIVNYIKVRQRIQDFALPKEYSG